MLKNKYLKLIFRKYFKLQKLLKNEILIETDDAKESQIDFTLNSRSHKNIKKQVHFNEAEEIIIIPPRSKTQLWKCFCSKVGTAAAAVLSILCFPCLLLHKAFSTGSKKEYINDTPHYSGQSIEGNTTSNTNSPKSTALSSKDTALSFEE